ncbi:11609_t:CDS:1, partial [Gigaspora rosea]
ETTLHIINRNRKLIPELDERPSHPNPKTWAEVLTKTSDTTSGQKTSSKSERVKELIRKEKITKFNYDEFKILRKLEMSEIFVHLKLNGKGVRWTSRLIC